MAIANDKAVVQAVVPNDLKRWLQRQAQAQAQGRSLSNYVSYLLEQEQQEKKQGQQFKQTSK